MQKLKLILASFVFLLALRADAQISFLELKPSGFVPTPTEILAKERIVQADMAEATWFIKSNSLEQCLTGRYLSVHLPGSSAPITFKSDGVYSLTPENYYWSGYNSINGSSIQISRTPGGVLAAVWHAPESRYYGIETLSPETDILIKYNPSFLPVGDVCGSEEEESQSMPPQSGGCAPTDNDIRVLFLFSPAAAARLGTFGAAGLSNRIIGELNTASVGSGIAPVQASFTLAGVAGLPFVEDPCSNKTKKALLNNAEAKSLRNIFFADIVCLIINDVHLNNPPCDASGNAVNNAGADDAYCFAEITTATTQFKATHGIGHVMGLGHQRCSNCWNLRCLTGFGGEAYARGFRINATSRTIMADCDNTVRFARWSADMVPLGGFPTGDADNDNARRLRERANAVACFRPNPPLPPLTVTINGPSTICGGGTRTYSVSSSGDVSQASWSMKTDVTYWEPAGTGETVTITAPTDDAKIITLRVNVPGNGGGGGSATITIKIVGCRSNFMTIDRLGEERREEEEINEISVFPNPTQDQLFLKGTKPTDKIVLYDLQGKSFKQQNGGIDTFIDTQKLPSGLYLLTITSLRGAQHFKIVIP